MPLHYETMNKPKSIFYLDDDRDDLDFFNEAAESSGYKVSLFLDGKDMLEELKSRKRKPDIIFLDVHMPILDGEEILKVLKNSTAFAPIPIAMISGLYPKKLVKHFLDSGADYLVKKRPSVGDLKIAIDEVVGKL